MDTLVLLATFVFCASAHFVMACVMALFARYKVQYLALMWIMLIFAAGMAVLVPLGDMINGTPGVCHPVMLLSLTAIIFLQSIYPLSITMPAYLQWGRMLRYAAPAVVLYSVYLLAYLLGMEPVEAHSLSQLFGQFFSGDVILRILCLALSLYYLVNILHLPRKLLRKPDVPRYLLGYSVMLCASLLLYMGCALWYAPVLVYSYVLVFTLLNLYISFRALETLAMNLPKPVIAEVREEPTPELIAQTEQEDFNEANLQRFQRVEYWMQNHKESWTQSTFNRDQLCFETGVNRHLLLQCLRSQGYNDTHEYLNTYRFQELKTLIQQGKVRSIAEVSDAGFGTAKTAKSVFLNMEGTSLSDFLAQYKRTGSSAGA